MKREYDLIRDLGRENWLDAVAGEAYLLGCLADDPELSMQGTVLAGLIRETPYDNDGFSRVIAAGMGLIDKVSEVKKRTSAVLFIDEVATEEESKRDASDWGYDLVLLEGGYQIRMVMPEYYGKWPDDERAELICEAAKASYKRFDNFLRSEKSVMMGSQKMDSVEVWDGARQVYRQVDFDHECGYKRGQLRIFYFDDYSQVMDVWRAVKTISSRKTSD